MTIRISRQLITYTVLVAVFIVLSLQNFNWLVDDLYIYFRFAENFANGLGICYNEGEPVEGFSSFTWFLIVSAIEKTGLPLEASSKYLSLSLAVVNSYLIYLLARKILTGKPSIVAPAIAMFNLPFMLWAISGFELMLYISLILTACILCVANASKFRYNILAIVLFLIVLSRPEGILISLSVILYIIFVKREYNLFKKHLGIFIILVSAFSAFRLVYFGDIVPNTYYAKIGHGLIGNYELRSYKNGLMYFMHFLKYNPQFIPAVIFSVYVIFHSRKLGGISLYCFVLAAIVAFNIFSGGDWMVQYRFAVPAIPFLSLLTIGLMKMYEERRTAVMVSAVAICIVSAVSLKIADHSVIEREIALWNNVKAAAPEMNNLISPGDVAASGACGIIPYFLPQAKIIDMVGLTDKEIARNGYRTGMWFEKSLPPYVYSLDPDWLIMWKKDNGEGYEFRNAAPVYAEMANDPNFSLYEQAISYDVLYDVRIELYKRKDGN